MRAGCGRAAFVALVLGSVGLGGEARAQLVMEIEREPIAYSRSKADDPIARLQKKLDAGKATLGHEDDGLGYLKAVLEALGISPTSQTLVFSKTSFQHTRIAPKTPRAIYFNDDVYVGYVRGADVLEFSAVDPKLGATFYLLDQEKSDEPAFLRQTDICLQCHQSAKTRDVPGHLVRSVFPDRRGFPVFNAGSFVTDHSSPMNERWGGWYVTGEHGDQRHLGNAFVTDRDQPDRIDLDLGANLETLDELVDTGPYLTRHSDIVALMVLEHQTQMHNLITLAGYQARLGRHYDAGINKALGRPEDALSPSTERRIQSCVETLVRYMLFSQEPKLTAPVAGTAGFAEDFGRRGPRDRRGRSLRDFDLKTRLFRYPCSYLIHSEAFHALPAEVKERTYARLLEILTGRDQATDFAHLTPDDRRAILEILQETQPDLPASWRSADRR